MKNGYKLCSCIWTLTITTEPAYWHVICRKFKKKNNQRKVGHGRIWHRKLVILKWQNKCKKYAWMESNRRTSKVSHIKYMKSGHIATLGKQLILPNSVHEAADLVPMEWFLLGGEIAKENKKKVKENDEIQVTNGMKNRSWGDFWQWSWIETAWVTEQRNNFSFLVTLSANMLPNCSN